MNSLHAPSCRPARAPHHRARRVLAAVLAALCGLTALAPHLSAQGCVAARHMALSLGPDGITQLQPGQWEAGVSLRYLYADQGWLGTHRWPAYSTVVGNQITVVSTDFQITYAYDERFSATLTVPFMYGQTSNPREHDGTRHVVHASGLGDLRLVGNAWLLKRADHPEGNIAVGFGLKLPTGSQNATATFQKPGGPQELPVDISIQPGDGGWGYILELSGYRRLGRGVHGYCNGFYLVNPREQNDAFAHNPIQGQIRHLSVTDQYLLRAGVSWAVSPSRGLALSLGGRIDGVPSRDLIGGNEGFRRPGFVLYAEPGLTWAKGGNTFNLYVPLRLDANRTRNVYDDISNTDGGGAFAESLVVTSFSRRF